MIERFAATIVDRVVRSAPAQVMVVTAERWPEQIETVLLAYERGPHSKLSADLAEAFGADPADAGAGGACFALDGHAPRKRSARRGSDEQGTGRALSAQRTEGDPGPATSSRACCASRSDADLIVIGGTEAGVIEQLLAYAPPLELADRTSIPVITVYEMAAEPRALDDLTRTQLWIRNLSNQCGT